MLCLLQLASVKGRKSVILVLLSWCKRPVAGVPAVGHLLLTLQQTDETGNGADCDSCSDNLPISMLCQTTNMCIDNVKEHDQS